MGKVRAAGKESCLVAVFLKEVTREGAARLARSATQDVGGRCHDFLILLAAFIAVFTSQLLRLDKRFQSIRDSIGFLGERERRALRPCNLRIPRNSSPCLLPDHKGICGLHGQKQQEKQSHQCGNAMGTELVQNTELCQHPRGARHGPCALCSRSPAHSAWRSLARHLTCISKGILKKASKVSEAALQLRHVTGM